MNQLLADLNAVWRDREKKSIARVQNNAHREVEYLRRQISFRKPYEQVMQAQDIRRLKKTVKDTQTALRENVASIEESTRGGPLEGLHLVDSTVKFTNQVLEERRRLQDENEQLKRQLEGYREAARHEGFEREKFYDGAAWMGREAVGECEEALRRCAEVRAECRKRMEQTAESDILKERVAEWVVDSCERIAREAKEHTQARLENAMRNRNANAKYITQTLYEITK
jgi:hypothetical protein